VTAHLPIPGARLALTAYRPAAPVLAVRYRDGVVVGGDGFPLWAPYALAVVELPPVPAGRGVDEMRVLDVLVGNEALAAAGSPLAAQDRATPPGWVWAHQAGGRLLMLVPAELHASFAHLGGVSTMGAQRDRRGVAPGGAPEPVGDTSTVSLPEAALSTVESALGYRLPGGYRDFLLAGNGSRPAVPALHPRHGFVADQYLFGLGRQDLMTDLVYANGWLGDRLTPDFLAVGHVQGGLLAVRVRGQDSGSVWYLDDDDPRDADPFDAGYRCAHLLHRLADDFSQFWSQLRPAPYWLRRLAADVVAADAAALVSVEHQGSSLPPAIAASARAGQPPALVTDLRP
jgi:A nuclease of the HNH/ENDO VII superfamily with conserved WHH